MRILSGFLLSILIGGLSCSPLDRGVGAPCRDDFDCRERCLEDWPGGFCTMNCDDDRDCPPDAVCSDTRGGVCLFPCDNNAECRDMLDDNDYVCDRLRNRGGGSDDVCVPD